MSSAQLFLFLFHEIYHFFFLLIVMISCKHAKQSDDEIYSRHLQRKVKLTYSHSYSGG